MSQHPAEYDLTAELGTAFDLTVTWTGQDLFNYTGTFEIFRGNKVFLSTTEDLQTGTLVPDEILVAIPTSKMVLLTKGVYRYRLDMIDLQGKNFRLLKGQFKIL